MKCQYLGHVGLLGHEPWCHRSSAHCPYMGDRATCLARTKELLARKPGWAPMCLGLKAQTKTKEQAYSTLVKKVFASMTPDARQRAIECALANDQEGFIAAIKTCLEA